MALQLIFVLFVLDMFEVLTNSFRRRFFVAFVSLVCRLCDFDLFDGSVLRTLLLALLLLLYIYLLNGVLSGPCFFRATNFSAIVPPIRSLLLLLMVLP